jgi:hypothetical protein
VRKVIDFGALNSPELREFLGESRSHFAVLTDYLGIEAFKQQEIRHVRKAFDTVRRFPGQIIILKPGNLCVRLATTKNATPDNFIDREQTGGFSKFCDLLADDSQIDVLAEGRTKQQKARTVVGNLGAKAESLRITVKNLRGIYSNEVISALKTGRTPPVDIREAVAREIFASTKVLFNDVVPPMQPPPFSEAAYSLFFRFALSLHALAVWWIAHGGHEQVPIEKLRNDGIDTVYVAYSTFFDGIITKDKRVRDVHLLATSILAMLLSGRIE